MDKMIEDIKDYYKISNDTKTSIEILKRVRRRSSKVDTSKMCPFEIEYMEDHMIQEEAEKIGFDYKIVYTLDNSILRKYITK